MTAQYTAQVVDLAHRRNLSVHLDGARIFNAAVALGVDVKELTRGVDSLSFCLSKDWPHRSARSFAARRALSPKARLTRKILGGGMRQAGIIAAAGIVALDKMVGRIREDHDNAARLATEIADRRPIPRFGPRADQYRLLRRDGPGTGRRESRAAARRSRRQGLKHGTGPFRTVTHYGIEADDIDQTLSTLVDVMRPDKQPVPPQS